MGDPAAPETPLRSAAAGLEDEPFSSLLHELKDALGRFWNKASAVLQGSGVRLYPPAPSYDALEENFFSALFLYSYHCAGIPQDRRVLYAAVNQCLRGMVTGCDNLLDDEYKQTLDTDLPCDGHRFRSVLDIMVSDRVLYEILFEAERSGLIAQGTALRAGRSTLHSLARSGAQEASEERGVKEILPPSVILDQVHRFKTGILFQCPWDVPRVVETVPEDTLGPLLEALYEIGMGCQILDDLVDWAEDLRNRRHNYLLSLAWHGGGPGERRRLGALLEEKGLKPENRWDLFPRASERAASKALQLLTEGFTGLYEERHRAAVGPSIVFVSRRIGAELFPAEGRP